MNKKNLLLLFTSMIVVACNHSKKEPWIESESNVQAPLPPHAPIAPLGNGQSANVNSNSQSTQIQEPAVVIPDKILQKEQEEWHPKEGDLVKAGELIMNLKKEKQANPTNEEMVSYLQNNMSITSSQAHLILEELGLE
ncbi:MAG: hypothetical protein BGO77_05225 [Caedibacter sp. 37-49]|nr:MAG: hypothetical protein BGO77_05225 [Caedibacter sp. 37-49]